MPSKSMPLSPSSALSPPVAQPEIRALAPPDVCMDAPDWLTPALTGRIEQLLLEGATEEELCSATALTPQQFILAMQVQPELQVAHTRGTRVQQLRLRRAALDPATRMLGVLVSIAETETQWEVVGQEGSQKVLRTGPSPAERITAAKAVLQLAGADGRGVEAHEMKLMGEQAAAPTTAVDELAAKIGAAVAEAQARRSGVLPRPNVLDVSAAEEV